MSTRAADPSFLTLAIHLALENVESGGGPFGAVVVHDGVVVGRGTNRVTSMNDPTAHAEIMAIREACRALETFRLEGCDLYASCEPCPMCVAAVYWSRVDRVFYVADRKEAVRAGFDDEWIEDELAAPAQGRTLLMERLPHEDGAEPFAAWRRKPDKIPY